MKKRFFTMLIGVFFLPTLFTAQIIKVKPTIAFTSIKSKIPILDKNINTYGLSLGTELMDRENYLINTEFGFHQRGGREVNPLIQGDFYDYSKKQNYLFLLATFRYKFPFNNFYVFTGIGSQLEYLLHDKNDFKNTLYNEIYELNKLNFNIVPEVGIIRTSDRINYGIELSYPVQLSKLGSATQNKLFSNMFKIGISVGYNLK